MVFVAGELAMPGTFLLLPFGLGAAGAALLAFLGVSLAFQWLVFLVITGGAFAVLLPLQRRWSAEHVLPPGVGADRLVGETGSVLETIPSHPTDTGVIRIGGEEWRAESESGSEIVKGAKVEIVSVRGTRAVVIPQKGT